MPPDFVVWPSSTEQVSDICKVCTAGKIPIIPHGTGTGLEGGTTAVAGGVAVNVTKNMEQIEAIFHEDFSAIIRPGVTREGLNQVNQMIDLIYLPLEIKIIHNRTRISIGIFFKRKQRGFKVCL